MIFPKHFPQRASDFAHRTVTFYRLQNRGHEIATVAGTFLHGVDSLLPSFLAAFGAEGLEAFYLAAFEVGVVGLGGDAGLVVAGELVDADDDGVSGFDAALVVVGGVLDLLLDPAALDGAEHAA